MQSTIRSAQFLDTYFPIVDGVVQTVHNYAEIMSKISYSCVVTPKASTEYDDSQLKYDVIRTPAIKIPFWEYSYAAPHIDPHLKKQIAERQIDILHSHSPFALGAYARSLGRELNIPVVATFHSKYYDDCMRVTGSKAISKVFVKRIVDLYNTVDSVWAVSEGTADTLRSYGFGGDIFVINNGTNFVLPGDPQTLRREAMAAYSIPDDKKILLFVGHQIWQKNIKLVLDTFRMLADISDEYRLIIVGDGYHEVQIRDYAAKLNFKEGDVRFLGRINDRRLLSGVFLCGDLFFFPSVYDNAPLVVREAAAMGLPSLLTVGSNAAECVKKDISGFTAEEDPGAMLAEIQRVFSTEGLLRTVGENARLTIPVPWEQLVERVYEKYAEIIEQKKRI